MRSGGASPYDSAKLVVRHTQVRRLLVLETGDSNQTSNIMVALNTDAPLLHGKQKLTCLLIQVRAADKALITVLRDNVAGVEGVGDGGKEAAAAAAALDGKTGPSAIAELVAVALGHKPQRPKVDKVFAGMGGRGCLQATLKFNAGHVFLLHDGFAFVDKPAIFLHFDDVADLRLMRADGGSSTFDIKVTPEGGAAPLEFSQIRRDELDGVSWRGHARSHSHSYSHSHTRSLCRLVGWVEGL